ncbi:MAG: hypothetical protein HY000_25960 [Planctomycetes bacterium]|nr:hypothetical protein [Planctomycetota bacterium]
MNGSISCCPGVTKFLLVVLRLAIGWHFLYEGLHKLESQGTPQAWSAEGYLRGATGPFADFFHKLADDKAPIDFDQHALLQRWRDYVERFGQHFQLDDTQRKAAQDELDALRRKAEDEFFHEPQFRGILEQWEQDRQKQQAKQFLSSAEAARLPANEKVLSERVAELTQRLKKQLEALLSDEQQSRGPISPAKRIDRINLAVMWGLVAIGGCLMLGLFSRLACLGAAGMLALFYLSMPPLPGLPGAVEGNAHYLYVSKNLIEMIAALALATTGSGRWAGLDALVRACITRPLFGAGRKKAA